MAEHTGITVSSETIRRRLAAHEIVFSQPQHTISSPDPDYAVKKKTIEEVRDGVKEGDTYQKSSIMRMSSM